MTFSIVAARTGHLDHTWRLPDNEYDPRLIGRATRSFASVRPVFLDDDTTPTIKLEASLTFFDILRQRYSAVLHLLGMSTLLLHRVIM